MSEPRKFRRLFWDIETSPDVVFSWRTGFKLTIGPENILQERAIICIAWKWEGEETVHSLHWRRPGDDKAMLKAFFKVAHEADELVAHNGDRFDIGWFRTRCLKHGAIGFPHYKTVDTLQWARRLFYFNSNKLDYIARFLGIPSKFKTSFDLWKRVVAGDQLALADMVRYCEQDVRVLEQVWDKLRSAAGPKSHVGVAQGGAKWTCPHDGSTKVHLDKTRISPAGTVSYQMQCNECGRYYTIGAPAYKAYLAAKKLKA